MAHPESVQIVFDRDPAYAKGKYALTVSKPYTATLVNDDLVLYQMTDDNGIMLNLSMYGSSIFNGGNWHIEGERFQKALVWNGIDSEHYLDYFS